MEQRYALSGGRQQAGLAVLSSGKCKLVFWIFCIAGDEFMQENMAVLMQVFVHIFRDIGMEGPDM